MCLVRITILFFAFIFLLIIPFNIRAESVEKEVRAVMRKAADFMTNTVSTNGGYVYRYSEDLSQRWGEVPARKSQIWVQPPGTPSIGMMYLEAYRTTGEQDYLLYAEKAANALIWGQHHAGGWHYLIDFDMPGIQKWYDEVASRCWGWEEYLHYYGNCTFDDYVSTAPVQFLLDLYMENLDPKYRAPLIKGLDFIFNSQYPNGAWPQRYPLMYNHPHGGHDDYTHYYTFNDDVISHNIDVLLKAWEKLGNDKYRDSAYCAMDFYFISQISKPQAGWAQQYNMELKPAWGRSYEPDAVCTVQTIANIQDLMKFYKITGNRKYLAPIPDAIKWLENSVINTNPSKKYTHAYFYELGTNKPLWSHREGSNINDGHYWVDYDITDYYPYGVPLIPDIKGLKSEYKRVSSMSAEQAMKEYKIKKSTKIIPHVDHEKIEKIISSMDKRGIWITEMAIPKYFGDAIKEERDIIQGLDISVYMKNMYMLINYLKGL